MSRQSLHYFLEGNTSQGRKNLYQSNLEALKKVYYLNLLPGMNPTEKLSEIGRKLEKNFYAVEYIHSPLCVQKLKGIIIPELSIGIVDMDAFRCMVSDVPGVSDVIVDFSSCVNFRDLSFYAGDIKAIRTQIKQLYKNVDAVFGEALKKHDEWEEIYIKNIDFEKIDALTKRVIEDLLEDRNLTRRARCFERYFGAATCQGSKDFVQNITEDISKRYFIKGRPGSGKSTMLKKLNKKANSLGLDTELYHCGFDSNSVDMVLIPQISTVIFDSTAPHEYFPEREGDFVIDVYDIAINPETDEENKELLQEIKASYKELVASGTKLLQEIYVLEKELNQIYCHHINHNRVNKIISSIEKGFNWI